MGEAKKSRTFFTFLLFQKLSWCFCFCWWWSEQKKPLFYLAFLRISFLLHKEPYQSQFLVKKGKIYKTSKFGVGATSKTKLPTYSKIIFQHSTFLPYQGNKNHSTLEVGTFKVMLFRLIINLAYDFKSPLLDIEITTYKDENFLHIVHMHGNFPGFFSNLFSPSQSTWLMDAPKYIFIFCFVWKSKNKFLLIIACKKEKHCKFSITRLVKSTGNSFSHKSPQIF